MRFPGLVTTGDGPSQRIQRHAHGTDGSVEGIDVVGKQATVVFQQRHREKYEPPGTYARAS
jgi:hypothetical protein